MIWGVLLWLCGDSSQEKATPTYFLGGLDFDWGRALLGCGETHRFKGKVPPSHFLEGL